jgi:Fanconi anemia group M protein
VGPVHAKSLLSTFGSVKAIVNASHEELLAAEGIGPSRAKKIRGVLDSPYRKD